MSGITCANCGTSVDYGMKFCRRCGTPLDSSEAATRAFDEPPRNESFTQLTNSPTTSPSFSPPSYMSPAEAPATNALGQQTGQNKTVWILASVAVISLVAVIVLVAMLLTKPASNASQADRDESSTVIAPPPPPQPPPPTQRGGTAPPATSDITASLVYPGAQETMRVGEAGGKVLGLRTSDPLDKVLEYYKTKTGLTTQILVPGEMVMLVGQDVAITISREDAQTNIIITSGSAP